MQAGTPYIARLQRHLLCGVWCAVGCLLLPGAIQGQQPVDAPVFSRDELDTPPKFAKPDRASRAVADSYPAQMKRMGISGTAQVEFIVTPEGKVEGESIRVVSASTPVFGEAAKAVVKRLEFEAGVARGQRVRSRVLLPIVYK